MSTEAILSELKTLREAVQKQDQAIAELQKPVYKGGKPSELFGAPAVRQGEDPLTSRGYSYVKLFGLMKGVLTQDEAKVELEVHNRIQKNYVEGTAYKKAATNSIMAPFSTQHLAQVPGIDEAVVREIGERVKAGVTGLDMDEVRWLRQKYGYAGVQKAMSWVDDPSGGALVGPPMMGELIDILRNNEALLQAGCRDIGMPPTGRITFPRQTDVSTAYWIGESTAITESQPAAGDVILTAKKLGCLVRIPNELFRFASVGVEQFVRDDIAKVMALRMDKSLLEAVGSAVEPKGLINYAGINSYTASTVATDGNTLAPTDPYLMVAAVEEKNAEFKSWIMRPGLYSRLRNRRADAVNSGDAAGPFLFDILRDVDKEGGGTRGKGNLAGYPVIKSTQVSQARTKGSSTNLTYLLGGDFSDYVLAMGGVIEFAVSPYGDTAFAADQTLIRAIHYCDGAPRREASFVLCDTLYVL